MNGRFWISSWQELKLSASDLTDPQIAVRVGRIVAARLIATGSFTRFGDEGQLGIRVIETETTRIKASVVEPVAPPRGIDGVVERVSKALLQQLHEAYPLQGRIAQVTPQGIIVNIGTEQGVTPGHLLQVFGTEESDRTRWQDRELSRSPGWADRSDQRGSDALPSQGIGTNRALSGRMEGERGAAELRRRSQAQARVFCVLSLLPLLCMMVGCAVEQGKIYIKDGKQYGVTSSMIWRGEWWNYYERGSSYAEGAFWPDAIADFQEAIKQRETDQRRARTYGLHFIDYFPHRELGISYYHVGRYPEAIRELETSLLNVDTAKAKFYLNKARQVLFRQTKPAAVPPRILIDGPLDGLLTNRFTLQVTGHAEADAYVSAIAINGRPLLIELAEPSASFAQDIALRDGPNPIEIVSVDLLGQLTRHLITVYVDRQGPLLSLDAVEVLAESPQQRVRVKGFLSDRSRMVRFLLAGRKVSLPPEREWEFREEVSLMAGLTAIPFEAEDAAGNVTRGEIALSPTSNGPPGIQKGEPGLPLLPRWAFLNPSAAVSDFPMFRAAPIWTAQGSGRAPPTIKLTDLTALQVVYYDAIYLEGKVSGASAITAFSINGEPLSHRKGRQLFFGYLAPLQPGDNRFLLEAAR